MYSPDWRLIQKENFTNHLKLIEFLELDKEKQATLLKRPKFPLNLPKRLADKIEKNSLDDPLLLQFLPSLKEEEPQEDFLTDPVSDQTFQKSKRLLQKYSGRVLLMPTSACVMNCRFCFRQNYPYETTPSNFEKELETIKKDKTLFEVILSGGDPLSLSDSKLEKLILSLEQIPHIKLLRFHTRFPIGIPERITPSFVNLLKKSRLQTIFTLHTNHPKEIDKDLLTYLKKLQILGIPILTQTVLLKGVNDSLSVLKELFLKLIENGIIPYYLHQLDKVKGAKHFEVSTKKGAQLIDALRTCLPGYALPTYVQEISGEKSKTSIAF